MDIYQPTNLYDSFSQDTALVPHENGGHKLHHLHINKGIVCNMYTLQFIKYCCILTTARLTFQNIRVRLEYSLQAYMAKQMKQIKIIFFSV